MPLSDLHAFEPALIADVLLALSVLPLPSLDQFLMLLLPRTLYLPLIVNLG